MMEREKNDILYLVVPCYNEQEVLPETSKRLKEKMESLMERNLISRDSRIMFVNDGSKDRTWSMIEELHEQDPIFAGVKLSRNRGHQNALLGGLMTAKEYADMTISLDADLQDDIDVIDQMVEKYYDGCEIVYGVRSARTTDTFFKRFTAESFYHMISMMGGEIVFNHADYRLMSKRALEEMAKYKEVNLFLRGIVPMIGFKTDVVTYERHERMAGESKYPLKKMLALAIDAKTTKLKYGHRGVNHPVKDIDEDRTYITSQNHGYAVVGESVDPQIARVRYVNLNDGTVEGLEHIGRPVFTVQYHPEVCPGPMDTSYLFDKFIENIEKSKGGAQ